MNASEYTSFRNEVFRLVTNRNPCTSQELREIGRKIIELKKTANEIFKQPPTEDIENIIARYSDKVKAECERVDSLQQQSLGHVQELQAASYVDNISSEEEATVNALTIQYLNEFTGLPKDGSIKMQQFLDKVLDTRTGAMALLRFPQSYISSSASDAKGKIPRRYIDTALQKAKSPAAQEFERNNAIELKKSEKEYADYIVDHMHLNRIRDVTLPKVSGIAESQFFGHGNPYGLNEKDSAFFSYQ